MCMPVCVIHAYIHLHIICMLNVHVHDNMSLYDMHWHAWLLCLCVYYVNSLSCGICGHNPPNKKEVHAHAVIPPRTWGLGQIMTNHSLKQCGKSAPHLPPRNKTGRARPHSTLKVPGGHHFVKVVWLCAPWEFGNLGNPWKASLELNGFLAELNIDEHCTSRTGSHGSAIQHCYKVHCKYTAHLHRSYQIYQWIHAILKLAHPLGRTELSPDDWLYRMPRIETGHAVMPNIPSDSSLTRVRLGLPRVSCQVMQVLHFPTAKNLIPLQHLLLHATVCWFSTFDTQLETTSDPL